MRIPLPSPTVQGELILPNDNSPAVNPRSWRAPKDPVEQAKALRAFLRSGKNRLVLACEETRQVNPENYTSPVIVCSPENCDIPCFNCMIAILTGQKPWLWRES